jgi:predicted permease
MTELWMDLVYAARKLRSAPVFTLTVVATLALGVGANVAVFSIVNSVLLKPLPYRDSQALVRVATVRARDARATATSPLDFLDYRSQSSSLAGMAAMDQTTANLRRPGAEPLRLRAGRVSGIFFDVLGVRPALGRMFHDADDSRDVPAVVVLSWGTWQDVFSADPSTVGRTISLNGNPYIVVGVAPQWMRYPGKSDVWIPMRFTKDDVDPGNRGAHWLTVIGRLANGATLGRANRELGVIAARLAQRYPETNTQFGAAAQPLQEVTVKDARRALVTLLGAVGFVLLVACANIANLLLVRASTRETEMAVRAALGAGRGRIARQLLTESVLLSMISAAVGIGVAWTVIHAVVSFGPRQLPRLDEIALDARGLAYAAGLAVVAGILFGLAPALHAFRADVTGMLKARGGGGRLSTRRARSIFVIAEMALAVVLLVGAGLFVQSFINMVQVDPGFRAARVTSANLSLPSKKYVRDHDVGAFGARLLDDLSHQPGIQAAAIGFGRPLGEDHMRLTFEVTGWPHSRPGNPHVAWLRPVSADYFGVLGVPVIEGRAFTKDDRTDDRQVLVVSRAFARQFFPGHSALDKHVTLGYGRDTSEWGAHADVGGDIVGVVGDVEEFGPTRAAEPMIYAPFAQVPVSDISIVAKSSLPSSTVGAALRSAVRRVDQDVPVFGIAGMADALADSVAQPRFYTMLLAAFAGMALLLSAIGIYGVISYGVTAGAREIGIRLALGATTNRVVVLTLRHGLWLAVLGLPIGLLGASWLERYVSTLLFGVGALGDARAFLLVPPLLLAVAAVASYLPARRAARVDPVIAMRAE